MKISIRKGVGFGLTSGIITTLGLIIGLHSATHSRTIVLGGILVIAIADAFSDALGIHISEEAGHKNTNHKEIWESTAATFFSKIIFTLSFVIPILLFTLDTAIIIGLIWGFSLLGFFSYYIAKEKGTSPAKAVAEHLIIGAVVVIITYFIGGWIKTAFV